MPDPKATDNEPTQGPMNDSADDSPTMDSNAMDSNAMDSNDDAFGQNAQADSQAVDEFIADVGDLGPAPEESRDEEMDRLRRTADEADKRVLMAQAEAENFRKRMRRDFDTQVKYASLPLVNDLLQVRDNMLRAIEAAGEDEAVAGMREGVAIVAKMLDDTLAKYGIKEIPAAGEAFDPNFHEAISQMPSEDVAEGFVAHVATPGFQMHDRVVRPAQVVVSTGKP